MSFNAHGELKVDRISSGSDRRVVPHGYSMPLVVGLNEYNVSESPLCSNKTLGHRILAVQPHALGHFRSPRQNCPEDQVIERVGEVRRRI